MQNPEIVTMHMKKATGQSDLKVRSRRIPVRIVTGREQNATLGGEERDGAVRSGWPYHTSKQARTNTIM
ncbi:hypothetical protein Taro_034283 [Colocasia esculenta]|uniref:Uncharacterized protein n=1 Tax=Colocasia esculenta TaxID=4460 RepID=A0A843W9K1_COLES|nr:hypothetical protein [Colocasia esculenta]